MGSELGMVTEVREVQPKKAKDPILVTELGMMISVKSLQPESRLPYTRQRFRESDGSDFLASTESLISNTRHSIADSNSGEARTSREDLLS